MASLSSSLKTVPYVRDRRKADVCVSEGIIRGGHLTTYRNLKKKGIHRSYTCSDKVRDERLHAKVIHKFKIKPQLIGLV